MTVRYLKIVALLGFVCAAGCRDASSSAPPTSAAPEVTPKATPTLVQVEGEIADELAKLSQEDRMLAEAQKTCPVTGERLGSMGVPPKLTIKGEPVFICCGSCKKEAEENPDKTLKAVAEAKAKAKGK